MMLSRRDAMRIGGLALAGLPVWAKAAETDAVEIETRGNKDGSHVWFEPVGLLLRPGQTVRWVNRDPGNAHTSTAYHPANDGHALRIPADASPWNSDYLLPDEVFQLTLTIPGTYD